MKKVFSFLLKKMWAFFSNILVLCILFGYKDTEFIFLIEFPSLKMNARATISVIPLNVSGKESRMGLS